MRSIVERRLAFFATLAALSASPAAAQYTPPAAFPADSAFTAVSCADPTVAPAQDSCTDDARDHRNIIGSGTTPAYQYYQDGQYLFLRIRVEDDPRQGGALVAFGWGFGLDLDGDGAFEAYVSLIGQGMADRLEIQDQDASNGTTPDLALPGGGGPDTSLRPIDTTGGSTWATATSIVPNFCTDDPDAGDWHITVAVPLDALRDFGALGGAIAYGGTSSEFSGIQNDVVCANGRPPACVTGATCPSGVCMTGIGRCAPPVLPVFLGCLDEDIDTNGIDDGCSAALPFCLVTSTSSSCVACLGDGDCNDANSCTTDSCESNACEFAAVGAGIGCPGGVCNGDTSAPACVVCVDDAPGLSLDTGCTAGAPVCNDLGPIAFCGGCTSPGDCDDSNECTAEACTLGACLRTSVGEGVDCSTGVCNGSLSEPACVTCVDDAPGTSLDSGCGGTTPVCDTSGALPVCVECTSGADCDDSNDCTFDACNSGVCDNTALGSGISCTGGICDSDVPPECVACLDDAPGTSLDTGCTAGAPICDTSGPAPVCTGCIADADCDDGNVCTADTCVSGACTASSHPTGTGCPGGVCDGASSAPACVACVDDASGSALDTGCVGGTPICDTSGAFPVCVECLGDTDCDDGNSCSTDSCSAGVCSSSGLPAGTLCAGGVCDGNLGAPLCIACIDDATGVSRDSGCTDGAPVCDTSSGTPVCTGCVADTDCDDLNECTTDACSAGTCVPTSNAAGTSCAGGVCDGAASLPACVVCIDSAPMTLVDLGCADDTPVCDTSGAVPACGECGADVDCDDGIECTRDACVARVCVRTPEVTGTTCSTGICDASTVTCVSCVDDAAVDAIDTGCDGSAALCDESGASPVCTPCIDVGPGVDAGCASPNEVCVPSGASNVCVTCEDTGEGIDFGCAGETPVCTTIDSALTCAECASDDHCDSTEVCNVAAGTCTSRCDEPSDCGGGTPVCDVEGGMCVECLVDDECGGRQTCSSAHVCRFPDRDGDGIGDDVDVDDDNDGIRDVTELDGRDLSADSDGDGVQDFEDPDAGDCDDGDGDGLCDSLSRAVDFDRDGIPNHLDLDSDGDGLTDLREGGGNDSDGDGLVAGFVDADSNGLDDSIMRSPLPIPNTDGEGGPDFLDLDADGDSLSDVREADGVDENGDGRADGSDGDSDGLADSADPDRGGTPWTGPDTDSDGAPDWRDVDSDGDSIGDSVEANDLDQDGDADLVPSGDDTDGDGWDDSYDPSDGGSLPSEPDHDGDGTPDWRDPDGRPRLGGFSGGALCTASPARQSPPLLLLALALVAWVVRRRLR